MSRRLDRRTGFGYPHLPGADVEYLPGVDGRLPRLAESDGVPFLRDRPVPATSLTAGGRQLLYFPGCLALRLGGGDKLSTLRP